MDKSTGAPARHNMHTALINCCPSPIQEAEKIMKHPDIPRQTSEKGSHNIEKLFEKGLWSIRYIVLLGVLFGAPSSAR